MTNEGQGRAQWPVASCDQEAWLTDRISDAVRMCTALRVSRGVDANQDAYALGRRGVIHGISLEILRVLHHTPCYENLPRTIPEPGAEPPTR